MKRKIKLKLKERTLTSYIGEHNLEHNEYLIPLYQKSLDAIDWLAKEQFFSKKEFKRYITDISDRIFTHLSLSNPDYKFSILYDAPK